MSMSRSWGEWLSLWIGLATAYVSIHLCGVGYFATLLVVLCVLATLAGIIVFGRFTTGSPLGCLRVFGTRVRSRVVSHTTLPLRNARIICHYDRHRLEIATLKGRGGPEHKEDAQTSQRRLTVDIDLRKVRQRHRFVEAVFRGAMCAHSAPSLPSDTLVG